jgi:hypothetical protein
MKKYRHGDLYIHPTSLPDEAVKIKEVKSHILALGEHTNHKHLLTATEGLIEMYEHNGKQYFVVPDAKLTHQEHKEITILPGIYVVEHEREYDYALEEINQVID